MPSSWLFTGTSSISELPSINGLRLANTRVTDEGLAHLKDLPLLHTLDLSHTKVTSAGLAHVKNLPRLACLALNNTNVGDAALARRSLERATEILGDREQTAALRARLALELDSAEAAITALARAREIASEPANLRWIADIQADLDRRRGPSSD